MKYLMGNKCSGFIRLALLFVLITSSCAINAQSKSSSKKQLKILSVGNSYSEDAFSYVPFILNNITDEVDLTFGIMYYPGCSLDKHVIFINNDTPSYIYDKWSYETGTWTSTPECDMNKGLFDETWDIIILQQASHFSNDYSTYNPFQDLLRIEINNRLGYQVEYAWLLTPAYGRLGEDSFGMYQEIAEACRMLMQESDIEILIPYGTAVQNARTTELK